MSLTARFRTPSLLAAAAALLLLGCSDGLDFDNDSFPAPLLAFTAAPATCQAVGAGEIDFELDDLRVTLGFTASSPRNRVDVSGTVSGIADTDSVQLLVLPLLSDCPILSSGTATVMDGTFTARADIEEYEEFRLVLVAQGGDEDDLSCDEGANCVGTAAGGFSALSETVEVRLTD